MSECLQDAHRTFSSHLDFEEKETTTARAPPCHVMAEKSKRTSKEKREGGVTFQRTKEGRSDQIQGKGKDKDKHQVQQQEQ